MTCYIVIIIVIERVLLKVPLGRKTPRTLYTSQRYQKTAQRRFSTVELGKGNSGKMCLQPAPEGAECL